jgi:hypothetical protein
MRLVGSILVGLLVTACGSDSGGGGSSEPEMPELTRIDWQVAGCPPADEGCTVMLMPTVNSEEGANADLYKFAVSYVEGETVPEVCDETSSHWGGYAIMKLKPETTYSFRGCVYTVAEPRRYSEGIGGTATTPALDE